MNLPSMNEQVLSLQGMLKQNSDVRGGRNTIVKNRETYFNRLDVQDDNQFESMIEMAPMYILYPKIVDGFAGTVFSKKPTVKGLEDNSKDLFSNIDMLGNSLDKLSEKIITDVFENGFCATYNDYSDNLSTPFLVFVEASKFVSYRTSNSKGYPEVSQFIFQEKIEVDDPEDEFSSITKNQFTVLDLVARNEGDLIKSYRIRTILEDGDDAILVSEAYPQIDGKNFDYIPMQIHGAEASNFSAKKSALQDLSDMNISIMQRVVDQVYMLHWTALPTPYVTGVDSSDNVPTTIGPSQAWHIPQSDSKVGMLEFSGNSARAHQDFIDNLKDIMAATGAQILKKEGVSRETATSVLVRTAAQTSLVSTIVNNVGEQIERVVRTHLKWTGKEAPADFSYTLNDDFIKVDMEPNAQIALVKSWLDGAISHKTVFNKMKEGEIVDTNQTFEDELAEIKATPPPYFAKKLEAELSAENETDNEVGQKGGSEQDDTTGSNLENGNTANKLGTEQV